MVCAECERPIIDTCSAGRYSSVGAGVRAGGNWGRGVVHLGERSVAEEGGCDDRAGALRDRIASPVNTKQSNQRVLAHTIAHSRTFTLPSLVTLES